MNKRTITFNSSIFSDFDYDFDLFVRYDDICERIDFVELENKENFNKEQIAEIEKWASSYKGEEFILNAYFQQEMDRYEEAMFNYEK